MEIDGNKWTLFEAEPEQAGMGLPYAPENWPEKGDIWRWKTGRRIVTKGGHFQDRYLYLPERLRRIEKLKAAALKGSGLGSGLGSGSGSGSGLGSGSSSGSSSGSGSRPRSTHIFPSKAAVERYVRENFPNVNTAAFMSSFAWRIPAKKTGTEMEPIAAVPLQQICLIQGYVKCEADDEVKCKAGNKECSSLLLEEAERYSPCSDCCAHPRFCRDCCCLICHQIITSADGDDYTHVKCQATTDGKICAHIAHMKCAFRGNMARQIGGRISVYAQYFCPRCRGRTDMISHITKILQACKTANLDGNTLVKILTICGFLLYDSRNPMANELMRVILLGIEKLQKRGVHVEEILNEDNSLEDVRNEENSLVVAHPVHHNNDAVGAEVPSNTRTELESRISLSPSLKIEGDVNKALRALREAHEFQYNLAEKTLERQKHCLQELYLQLEIETNELAHQNSPEGSELIEIRKRQIRRAMVKFKKMKKVVNDFSKISKHIKEELQRLN